MSIPISTTNGPDSTRQSVPELPGVPPERCTDPTRKVSYQRPKVLPHKVLVRKIFLFGTTRSEIKVIRLLLWQPVSVGLPVRVSVPAFPDGSFHTK